MKGMVYLYNARYTIWFTSTVYVGLKTTVKFEKNNTYKMVLKVGMKEVC